MKHHVQYRSSRVYGLILALSALFFVNLSTFAGPQVMGKRVHASIPAGSYRHTCRDIKIRRHRLIRYNLLATCRTRRGRWVPTRLKKYRRCHGDIANINGVLRCMPRRVHPPHVSPGYGHIPRGSYRQSCRNIRVRANALRARCRTRRGYWNRTHLYYFRRCRGDIANINGNLRCVQRPIQVQPGGHIPRGSYRRTCRNIRVRNGNLKATCKTRRGYWNRTRLYNYRRCHSGIANINGNLRCDRRYPGHHSSVPRGSYRHSCRNIRVSGNVLRATCRTRRGYWNRTRIFNYRLCRRGVANINGHLRCM